MVKIDGQFNYATVDCVRSFILSFVAVRRPDRTNGGKISKRYTVSADLTSFILDKKSCMQLWLALTLRQDSQIPQTCIEALKVLASQFEASASRPVFRVCVGALDRLTAFIKSPSATKTENALAYYPGHHYKHDSLNAQVMLNHVGKFLYFAVASPGRYPDDNDGFFVVEDNGCMHNLRAHIDTILRFPTKCSAA